ncbi:protein AAR2 homolog [Sitophilus oryzae]|uniref:Protein AAR2 homolog n=1 Tax=Sitophilus oryzae TaxID=7048 RepID=A0A6J2XSF2_SITOR|nr:protein AAR2 homolog [Sitophilus oryzae]
MSTTMDQNTAKKLFEKGGFFILLNVPEGTEFGIDLKSWNTGEKFRGIKMIPPGVHYIFYSSTSHGDVAPRTGLFHYFRPSEIVVKKWDKEKECLSTEEVSDEDIVGLKENIRALDSFLGPYPYDIWEKWKKLTSSISENVLKKLIPLNGEVHSALELEYCTDNNRKDIQQSASKPSTPKHAQKLYNEYEDDLLPNLKPKYGTNLQFSIFPPNYYPVGSSPAEITKHSLDCSYLFEQLLSTYDRPQDILGELEFCYVCFLVGHSLEAFEQWKKILGLFCSCDDAIKKYRQLYNKFLSIIELHVMEIPEEFLADIVSNRNFVYVKLRNLFSFIKECDVDGTLKCKADRLRKNLTEQYSWDFSHLGSDDEDDAPVIVDLESNKT